jgi:hypothetical protein
MRLSHDNLHTERTTPTGTDTPSSSTTTINAGS